MMWIRLLLFVAIFYALPARGQGMVLFPFDAGGRPGIEVRLFQETLAGELSSGVRLFHGEGVVAVLPLCCGASPSIAACLTRVGEHFEARWGARGRWEVAGAGGTFSLEIVDLVTGRMLFSGRNSDGTRSDMARVLSLVRRARREAPLNGAASVTVIPGMRFRRIPGEGPVPLYLQVGEVTQGQWYRVMGYNPSWFIACGRDCPVESVTREEIHRFLSRMNGLGRGRFRLPTIDEWQRGLDMSERGDPCLEGNNCVSYDGGYPCDEWPNRDEACARCGPRPFGGGGDRLVNMTGNVWEWVEVLDARGDTQGGIAGGGWADLPGVEGLYRIVLSPRFIADDVGFRMLMEGAVIGGGDTD